MNSYGYSVSQYSLDSDIRISYNGGMTKTLIRVTAKGHTGKTERRVIAVTEETERFLTGWVVDRDGTRTDRFLVIDQSAVVHRTPMRVNPKYGTLEPT